MKSPREISLSRPSLEELGDILDIRNAASEAEIGAASFLEDEVRSELTLRIPGVIAEQWLARDSGGSPVGYQTLYSRAPFRRIGLDGCVHPASQGCGIGSMLLDVGEDRAREIAEQECSPGPVLLDHPVWEPAHAGRLLLEQRGFRVVRAYEFMEIAMDDPPPTPVLADEIRIRTFIQGRDERRTFEANLEAFADHFGYEPWTLEEWIHELSSQESFDPSLVFLADSGDETVGVCSCRLGIADDPDAGFVDDLSVRRPWRRRGIARGLLLHAFDEFHRRGVRRVALEVDSENPMGAKHLYESAGMRVFRRMLRYEKELALAV